MLKCVHVSVPVMLSDWQVYKGFLSVSSAQIRGGDFSTIVS